MQSGDPGGHEDPSALATQSTVPPPMLDASGEMARGAILGRYVILRRVGRGGMGVVYLALDGELERRVAIKILRPEAAAGASAGETRSRLLREAQAMAKVSHPNVVAVYDVGTFDDEVFLAMEYVEGGTLRNWRTVGTRSAREIVAAYVQAGRGLEAAHAAGILHRDFKPDNVLVDEAGRVRVLDFGLARLETPNAAVPGSLSVALADTGVHSSGGLSTPLTAVGEILGTPAYMAPEQLVGRAVTARSDQFSFCLALYEALYGELPFGGFTVAERVEAMAAGRLRPTPPDARVPARVRRVVLRGLSGSEEARYDSMSALLGALEESIAAPKWRGWAIAVVGLALAITVIALTRPTKTNPCLGADEAIAPAWSTARGAEVERAFTTSGSAQAAEAFAHTKALLDRYAASWVSMSTEACMATRVRGVQSDEGLDLRTACLRQRAKELRATVDLFAHADIATVDSAPSAAARLTSVDTCVDLAALRARFAPTKDAAQKQDVDALRGKLATVDALFLAGKYDEAYPSSIALVNEANRIAYGPTQAEALLTKARLEFGLDKPEATDTFVSAALEAEGTRNDAIAAGAWVHAFETSSDRYHREDAARYRRLAEAAVRRLDGTDVRLQVLLLHGECFDAYRRSSPEESLAFAREEVTLAEKSFEPSSMDVLNARSDIADALSDQDQVEEALAVYQAIYRTNVSMLGETHSNSLRWLHDIGAAQMTLGDYEAARRTLEPMRTMEVPHKPKAVANGRVELAEALVGSGQVADGLALFDAAEVIMRRFDDVQGEMSDETAIAVRLVERQENAEAEKRVTTALEGFAKLDAPEDDRRLAYGVRALCRVRRGDAAGALADGEIALGGKADALTPHDRFPGLLAHGEALLALHRDAEALTELEGALGFADKVRGDLALHADARLAVARALAATHGDPTRITTLATSAAEDLDRVGLAPAAKAARAWLGEVSR